MAWFDGVDRYDSDVLDDMYAQALYDTLEKADREPSDLFNDVADYCLLGINGGFEQHPPNPGGSDRLDKINGMLAKRLKLCEDFSEGFDAGKAVSEFDAEAMLLAVQSYYEDPKGLPVDEFVDASFKKDGYVMQDNYGIIKEKIRAAIDDPDFGDRMARITHPEGDYMPQELMSRELFGKVFETFVNREHAFDASILGGVDVTKGAVVDPREKSVERMVENALAGPDDKRISEPEPEPEPGPDDIDSIFDFGG